MEGISEIFSTFHLLATIAVIVLVVTGIAVAVILAKVFRRDFEQD